MTPAERSIRMRTNLVVLTPRDRGYQDWADKRELLRLLDEARTDAAGTMPAPEGSPTGGTSPSDHAPAGADDPTVPGAPHPRRTA